LSQKAVENREKLSISRTGVVWLDALAYIVNIVVGIVTISVITRSQAFLKLNNAYKEKHPAAFSLSKTGAASTEITATSRVPRIVENLISISRSWCWKILGAEDYVDELS
jgi:hypothetical protein